MEMKLDMIKTIKRLSGQGQNDILKNKLREWLQTKEFTLNELLSHCREGTFQLSGGLLNKLGSMYSSGADGLSEDCYAAYTFFEMAAELGHAGGHANCAQYYFDGLAPGGKNNELALVFCSKAIELGLDKHMLMAEILFDMQQYAQAVTWLHKILQTKGSADKRRRTAARQLERQCLFKQLNRVFYTLHTSGTATDMASSTNATEGASNNAGRASTPTRGMHALAINTTTVSPTTTPIPTTSIFFSANTPRSQFLNERLNTNLATTNASSSPAILNINLPTELAGWVSISDQLEGFDRNACAGLTTQAEWLELEVQSARAGFESAQAHIASLRRDHLAEEIIALLETTKVAEFKSRYENMVKSKDVHLACWEEYINTQEHILRRQVNTEQAFFSAKNTNNKLTQFVATELLKLRTVDETAGEGPGEPFILNFIRSGGAPNSATTAARIPTARCLITAERALLDLATSLYPIQTYRSRLSIGDTDTNTESSGGICGNNISVLRNTGWTAVERARAAALAVASDPATIAAATFTNNSSTIGFVSTPTHSNTHNSNNNITPVTPRRSSTPLKSPLHSASMSNLRISMESPMKPSSDGYISPTPRSARGGVTSPTASSARQSVVPSVVQKTSQLSKHKSVTDADTALPVEPPALFTPAERIVVDNTPISYRCCTTVYAIPTDYNVHHSGFISDAAMSSDDVLTFFNHLTMVADDPVYAENERILSQIIQRFLHDGVPVQLKDLQCMNSDLNESDKGLLNKIVFHYFIRRVVRWLVPIPEESNSNIHTHKLAVPLASIYARALQLIEQGILTFSEAFDKDGMYGVFYCDEQNNTANASTVFTHDPTTAGVQHSTHSSHVPPLLALRNKCKHINALYQKYVVELAPRNFLPTIRFWKQHAGGATVPTYKLLYTELTQIYGVESDDTVDLETMCSTINAEDTVLQVLLQKLQS